jgi:hypothetical protein
VRRGSLSEGVLKRMKRFLVGGGDSRPR